MIEADKLNERASVVKTNMSILIPSIIKKDSSSAPYSVPNNITILMENTPYKIDTLLYIGTEASMRRYMKKNFNQDFEDLDVDFASVDGLTVECSREDGSIFILIWLPSFAWTAQKLGVLAHEIIHASVMVLRSSGVHSLILEEQTDSDDEALAHTADHMMEYLIDKLIKKCVFHQRKSKKLKVND